MAIIMARILVGAQAIQSCTRPPGNWFASSELISEGDCNDSDPAINPETVWVLDSDNDGYYTGDPVKQCWPPGQGYVIKIGQSPGTAMTMIKPSTRKPFGTLITIMTAIIIHP